jgi:hypothetical protein
VSDIEEWHRGDWMQTFTGKRYYPMNPNPADIDPVDIAHALSLLCRFGGHVTQFYSVAEHCILLSHAVDPENALHALLHDATEAYVVDVPRPVKQFLSNYKAIEGSVWNAIAVRFGIDIVVPEQVTEFDTRILLNERAALLPNAEVGRWSMDDMDPLDVTIRAYAPAWVERLYAERLTELLEEKRAA